MVAELNIRQDRFLKALLETPSVAKACELAGINKKTGYKYLKDEYFMTAYRELRRELMQQATAKLQKISQEAVEVLREIMNDNETTPSSRVQSAKAVLEISYRSIELEDIQEQIDELNKIVAMKE